jgi:hypothetical protein
MCFAVSDRSRDENSSSWLQAIVRPLPAPHRHLGSGTRSGHSTCTSTSLGRHRLAGVPQDPSDEMPGEGASNGHLVAPAFRRERAAWAGQSGAPAWDDTQSSALVLTCTCFREERACPPNTSADFRARPLRTGATGLERATSGVTRQGQRTRSTCGSRTRRAPFGEAGGSTAPRNSSAVTRVYPVSFTA